MPEVYTGTKFRALFAGPELPRDGRLRELVEWCGRLSAMGLTPGGSGNVSIRSSAGFIVSRTAADLGSIAESDFVQVLGCDVANAELTVRGSHEPSSESLLHGALYAARSGVGAILHGHGADLLVRADELALPVTERERPYGTPALAYEAIRILGCANFFLIRNHGFVALGRSVGEAGRGVEEVHARLASLQGSAPRESSGPPTSGLGTGGSGPIS